MKKILRLFLFGAFTALFIAPAMAEVGIFDGVLDDIKSAYTQTKRMAETAAAKAEEILDKPAVKVATDVLMPGVSQTYHATKDCVNASTHEGCMDAVKEGIVGTVMPGVGTAAAEYTKAKKEEKPADQTKLIQAANNVNVKNSIDYLATDMGRCIHVNDKAVETVLFGMVSRESQSTNTAAIKIEKMKDIFLEGYNPDSASICVRTIMDMCIELFNWGGMPSLQEKEKLAKCNELKQLIAYTMQFPASCNGGGGKCIKLFRDYVKVTPADGLFLINLWHEKNKKNMNDVIYCAYNDIKQRNNQDFMKCKTADGKNITNYEFEFDSLNHNVDSTIDKNVAEAGIKVWWGENAKYKDIDGTWAVNDVDEKSCKDLDWFLKTGMNGDAKFTKDTKVCKVNWNNGTNFTAKSDFDNAGFGTDKKVFMNLQIMNSPEIKDLLENYIIHKMEIHGKTSFMRPTCSDRAGDVKEGGETYRYIRCQVHDSNIGKTLQEDFLFKDTSEMTKFRVNAGKSGFECVTKHGGSFNGKTCSGLTKEQCSAINSQIDGGTKWDENLETCVFVNASDITKFDAKLNMVKKVTIGGAVFAVSVVAAIPSGGTSLVGVVALIGTTVALAGDAIQDAVISEAQVDINKRLIKAGNKKPSCENGDSDACEACFTETFSLLQEYNQDAYWSGNYESQATELLESCSSLLKPETYGRIADYIRENVPETKLSGYLKTGEILSIVGTVIGMAGIVGSITKFPEVPLKFSKNAKQFFSAMQKGVETAKKSSKALRIADTTIAKYGDFSTVEATFNMLTR